MKLIFFWPYQLYAWLILWPLAVILTLLFSTLAVIFSVLVSPRFASRVVASTWGRLLAWLIPVIVTVEGGDNAQHGRSYVVVCNHQSAVDILVVYGWLKLDLKWVLKAELRKVPGVGIGCEKAGHIFVDRSNPEKARKSVSDALDKVGNGVGVLFFAEGTRSPDGKLRPFKKGAFRVATSQNLPVLPVTIIGTRDIQKPKSMMIFPGKVRMVIHPAVEVGDGEDAANIRDLMTQTRAAIASALPEELR